MNPREKQQGFPGQRLVVVPRPVVTLALQQPLLKHLLPTDAGFYPRAHGHKCTREHGCPEAIFIYCAGGNGWCEVAGRRHEVARDQLLVIPAGTPHSYGAEQKRPWTIHWFHAVVTNVPFYQEKLGVTETRPVVPLGGDVRLFSLFEDVLEDLEHGSTSTARLTSMKVRRSTSSDFHGWNVSIHPGRLRSAGLQATRDLPISRAALQGFMRAGC